MQIVNNILVKIEDKDIVHSKVKIPNGVTGIGEYAFSNCKQLKKINIPKSVTNIGDNAFFNCESLSTITIPERVTRIGYMTFCNCHSLKSIIMPEEVIDIGESAFSNCFSLKSINIPKGVTNIGDNAFSDCESLSSISLPDSTTNIGEGTFNGCSSLKLIAIPKGVTNISDNAFSNCFSLKSIIMPEEVTNIGESAFYRCRLLESITIPNSVTNIGKKAFYDCKSLKTITLPEKITSIGESLFNGCHSLESITIPNSVTNIGKKAFYDCESLKSITLPEKITSIGESLFNGCHSLESIFIPNSVTSIDKSAFRDCSSLKSITIPDGVTSISPSTFKSCKSLESITLPDSVTCICKDTFKDCESLKSITIPDGVTYIGKDAFYNCKSLKQLITPYGNIEINIDGNVAINYLYLYANSILKDKHSSFDEFVNSVYINDLINSDSIYTEDAIIKFKNLFYKLRKNFDISPLLFDALTLEETEKFDCKVWNEIKDLVDIDNSEIAETVGEMIAIFGLFESDNNSKNRLQSYMDFIKNKNVVFNRCDKKFNVDFYNFLMKYMNEILKDEQYQRKIEYIQNNFQNMRVYSKLHTGSDVLTLEQATNYIKNIGFNNVHEGNMEFAMEVKKAGVDIQTAFEYYQGMFESIDKRKLSSLIKRSNIYKIDGYKIKTELLRKDDSLGILIGEINYTDCHQKWGEIGDSSLAHAIGSEDGGIFVTKLVTDDEEILLTESWDWQTNNVYCHDSIEETSYLENHEYLYSAVKKAIELDALKIISKSKKEVKRYITERKKKMERSSLSNEEKTKQLKELAELEKREVIRLVTVGDSNYESLGAIRIANNNILNNPTLTLSHFQPINYNSTQVYFNSQEYEYLYSIASNTQHFIEGDVKEIYLGNLKPLVPIYRDERRIVEEHGYNIRDYTLHKIKVMKEKIYSEDIEIYTNNNCLQDSHIILGEDWYLVYEERDNNSIYISDLARTNPELEDEKGIQNKEIMTSLNNLLETYDAIEADLKEDTSYLLYLMNKKLGLIEQIGEDTRYSFRDRSNLVVVSDADQANILKNIKQIRQDKNLNLIMHHVVFKKKDKTQNKRLIKIK